MRKLKYLYIFLSMLFLLLYAIEAIAIQDMVIVNNGSSPVTIITPNDPTPQENLAAKELSKYIEKITGARLKIKPENAAKSLIIAVAQQGRLKKHPAGATFTAEEAEFDSFLIQSTGKDLYLIGSNKRAVLYAVYTFLEKFGCRWPSFGINPNLDRYKTCEEYVPIKSLLSVGPLKERHKAAFKYRGFVGQPWFGNTPIQIIDWMAKNKMNYFLFSYPNEYEKADEWRNQVILNGAVERGIIIAVGHHSFSLFLDKEKAAKEHPEYLAMKDGKRSLSNKQICVSNPGVAEVIAQNIISFLKRNPEIDILPFYPDDGVDWCECEGCRSKLKWSGNHKSQSATESYQRFFNAVRAKVMNKFPDKVMDRLAYVHYSQVPEKEKIMPKTLLTYAVYWHRWWYKNPITSDGYLSNVAAEIKQWIKTMPGDIIVYEYYAGGTTSHWQGMQLHHLMASEILLYHSLGVKGLITASFWKYKDESALINYALARLLWDPGNDPETAVKEYTEARFGNKAAPFMVKYYNEMEKNSRQYLKYFESVPGEREKSYIACQKYLTEAKSLVETEEEITNLLHEQKVFNRYKTWQASK